MVALDELKKSITSAKSMSKLEFIVHCLGYAISFGNIWRFPYMCYRNGGGSFLVPYFIFLIVLGIPIFFLETSVGQFASLGPIKIWRVSPLFKGIGYGMMIVSGLVSVYTNVINAWSIYYLFTSFQATLPWTTCSNVSVPLTEDGVVTTSCPLLSVNGSLVPYCDYVPNCTCSAIESTTSVTEDLIRKCFSTSEEFLQRDVLGLTSGIENVGVVRWQLSLALMGAWFLVFIFLFKEISGKVVYLTATFPYVVLFILLIRGVTLPGAVEGLKFYLIPKWHKLLELQVWGEAAMQIFYSVGAAWGALVTMASCNKFHHNCYRDAFIFPILSSLASLFVGFVIFPVIGFMAQQTNSTVENAVTQGPGLIYVVIPEAVAKMPLAPLWSVLFFLMLLTVGLCSQVTLLHTITSAICEEFPSITRKLELILNVVLCFVAFLLGIPFITQGGVYLLQIMDWFCASIPCMILAFTEWLVFSWIYGLDRYFMDIELMIGHKPSIVFKVAWIFTSCILPATLLILMVFCALNTTTIMYGDKFYPSWALGFGWLVALCPIIPLPCLAIISIRTTQGTILQRVRQLCKPVSEWGPANNEYREQYISQLPPAQRQNVLPFLSSQSKENEMELFDNHHV